MTALTISRTAYFRKPVSTLAIAPKTRKITLLARKIWNVLLHHAQNAGFDKEIHEVPLSEIVRGLDFNSRDLKIIKNYLLAMVSTTVQWQSPTNGETPAWTVSGLLSHARLYRSRGELWVEWSYATRMRSELLNPDVYAKLSLDIISQFSTHAALVLYEIGKRYSTIGQTARQPWEWWVPVLTGRAMDERTAKLEYRIFKRDYLRCALAEVNTIADLGMELVEHKRGRFISELQFVVKKKFQITPTSTESSKPVDLELMARAERAGIEHARVEQLSAEYGEKALTAGLESLEKRLAARFPEPIRDSYRYLKFLLSSPSSTEVDNPVIHEQKKSSEESSRRAEKVKLDWVKQWKLRRHEQMAEEIACLSVARQDELTSLLLTDMTERKIHPARPLCLSTKGWRHPMVRHEMVSYYASAVYGRSWDKPTAEQLLELAATK